MLHNETLDVITLKDYKKMYNSCTIYIVLYAVFFITSIRINIIFICFQWYLKKNNVRIKFNTGTQTTIYETCKWNILNKLILKIEYTTYLMTQLILIR